MQRNVFAVLALGGALLAWPVRQDAGTATSRPRGDPELAKLSWLAGSWASRSPRQDSEEHWTRPKGGLMLGMHRDVRPGRKAFFEFLRIERQGADIVYLASPRGRKATPFRLTESAPNRAVFENPKHDFPQRIIYSLAGDRLTARVEATADGKTRGSQWVLKRARLAGR